MGVVSPSSLQNVLWANLGFLLPSTANWDHFHRWPLDRWLPVLVRAGGVWGFTPHPWFTVRKAWMPSIPASRQCGLWDVSVLWGFPGARLLLGLYPSSCLALPASVLNHFCFPSLQGSLRSPSLMNPLCLCLQPRWTFGRTQTTEKSPLF